MGLHKNGSQPRLRYLFGCFYWQAGFHIAPSFPYLHSKSIPYFSRCQEPLPSVVQTDRILLQEPVPLHTHSCWYSLHLSHIHIPSSFKSLRHMIGNTLPCCVWCVLQVAPAFDDFMDIDCETLFIRKSPQINNILRPISMSAFACVVKLFLDLRQTIKINLHIFAIV